MIGTKALTMAVAAVVLIGGMAAVGAAAPADQAPDTATDAYEDNAPEDADDGDDATGSEDADDGGDGNVNADRVGPSGGLPQQVPDHVSQIHQTIRSYLGGSVDSLGQALSDLLGNGAGSSASPAA